MEEATTELGLRWRYRGMTPSPDQWVRMIWDGVLAQFLVVTRKSERPLGLVLVYRANMQDQFAYLGAARFGAHARSPLMILGLALFVEYVFTCWPFHKLYLETPEYNYEQFAKSIQRYVKLEGRFHDHSYYGGRRWDQLVLALYRSTWRTEAERLLRPEVTNHSPTSLKVTMPPSKRDQPG
jgi:hypothetical protein